MDEKSYLFWRDFAGECVNGRMRLDDVIDWLQKGREMSEQLKALFQMSYQIDPGEVMSPDFPNFLNLQSWNSRIPWRIFTGFWMWSRNRRIRTLRKNTMFSKENWRTRRK